MFGVEVSKKVKELFSPDVFYLLKGIMNFGFLLQIHKFNFMFGCFCTLFLKNRNVGVVFNFVIFATFSLKEETLTSPDSVIF